MEQIHIFSSLTSTNSTAWGLAQQGEPHGAMVIAFDQKSGRGRLGKAWHTVPGKGLYCSIIARPKLVPTEYPKLTLVSGLAVALAIERVGGVPCQLKWPNDIYINGRKCAGILAEASLSPAEPAERFVILGIGINLTAELIDFPKELRNKVTSLLLESRHRVEALEMARVVRESVLHWLAIMEKSGFDPILESWKERDFLVGKQLEWLAQQGRIVIGESLGPDSDGKLRVRDAEGRVYAVLSGDVSLVDR